MAAWALVASLDTPGSGVFDFPSLTLSGYKVIQVIGTGIAVTTDGTDLKLTFYVGGSEVTSTYQWACFETSTGGSNNTDTGTSQAAVFLCSDAANWDVGNAAGKSGGFECTVDAPGDTALHKKVNFRESSVGPTGNAVLTPGCGLMANTGAIDGIKISGTSSFTAGKVRILGLA